MWTSSTRSLLFHQRRDLDRISSRKTGIVVIDGGGSDHIQPIGNDNRVSRQRRVSMKVHGRFWAVDDAGVSRGAAPTEGVGISAGRNASVLHDQDAGVGAGCR